MARENPNWGYTRIRDQLRHLGREVGRTTIVDILRDADLTPEPEKRRNSSRSVVPVASCPSVRCPLGAPAAPIGLTSIYFRTTHEFAGAGHPSRVAGFVPRNSGERRLNYGTHHASSRSRLNPCGGPG